MRAFVLTTALAVTGTATGLVFAGEPNKPAPTAAKAPAKPAAKGPTQEKAKLLREAASLLDKADAARTEGNRNLAELLFSSAELLTGDAVLAELAPLYREGAPPRVTTPLVVIPDAGAQPAAMGSSDDEDNVVEAPKRGSLSGSIKIAGAPAGTLSLITLDPVGKKGKARAAKQRIMEQRGREFAPRLMVIPRGSTVSFPNYDKVFHNVFAKSDTAAFDLGVYKEGQSRDVTFNKEGLVRLGCNLHSNMSATIVVVGSQHYVTADNAGTFRFRSLAPGKYRLRAWTERTQAPVEQDIVIKPGANTVDIGVKGEAVTPMADKFGGKRS